MKVKRWHTLEEGRIIGALPRQMPEERRARVRAAVMEAAEAIEDFNQRHVCGEIHGLDDERRGIVCEVCGYGRLSYYPASRTEIVLTLALLAVIAVLLWVNLPWGQWGPMLPSTN